MHSAGVASGGAPRRALDRALFGVAIAISAFVLLWPSAPGVPLFPYSDKIVHALVFAALAWTGRRAGLPVMGLGVGLLVYAVGSEVVQHTLLPGRSGDLTDVVADLVGVALGLVLARHLRPHDRAR